ncbi:MAG: hypothetical protein ACJ8F1_22605 [Polyangia bacterium]
MRPTRSVLLALVLAVGAANACGGDGGGGANHPDTGYGANETVPSTVDCTDLCLRAADCAAQLCNEDTMSTRYTGLASLLVVECESVCTSATLPSQITSTQWRCLFQSSCRQVYGENVCHTPNTSYTCS